MLRTLFVGVVLFTVTCVLAVIVVIAHMLGLDRDRHVAQWCMHTWARTACWAAHVRVVLHGEEHIVRGRGVVYASNHVSWYDVFSLAAVLPQYTFIAKAELRRIPIFGWGAEHAGVVFLERDNRKSAFAAYEKIAEQVRHGTSVVVCPEGTRGHDYHLRPFKKGPFVLAIAAGAPVIPVIVYGAREVMPKGSFTIRPGQVDVYLMAGVETTGFDYDHRHDVMSAVWNEMAGLLRERYGVGTNEAAYIQESA